MAEKKYVVYIHTNTKNKKVYVGITCRNPLYRWHSDGGGYKECPHFWNAIQSYGWDSFEHEIVATDLTKDEACAMEIKLIAE